jgi:hypothetical protein
MVGRRRTFVGIAALGVAAGIVIACGERARPPVVVAQAPEDAAAAEVAVAEAGAPEIDGGARFIPNADRVIASLRPRFKRCYERGLMREKDLQGKVVVHVRVEGDGRVGTAEITNNTGLGDLVGECIRAALETAVFEAPGAPSSLNVPVTFVQQKDPRAKRMR